MERILYFDFLPVIRWQWLRNNTVFPCTICCHLLQYFWVLFTVIYHSIYVYHLLLLVAYFCVLFTVFCHSIFCLLFTIIRYNIYVSSTIICYCIHIIYCHLLVFMCLISCQLNFCMFIIYCHLLQRSYYRYS